MHLSSATLVNPARAAAHEVLTSQPNEEIIPNPVIRILFEDFSLFIATYNKKTIDRVLRNTNSLPSY